MLAVILKGARSEKGSNSDGVFVCIPWHDLEWQEWLQSTVAFKKNFIRSGLVTQSLTSYSSFKEALKPSIMLGCTFCNDP